MFKSKILVIEDLSYLNDVLENINNSSEDTVLGIIFNSAYIPIDTSISFRRAVIPVFFSDNLTITNLKEYAIQKESLNFFIEITCKIEYYLDSVKLSLFLIKSLFYLNVTVTLVKSL
jgi:hypothetical protein